MACRYSCYQASSSNPRMRSYKSSFLRHKISTLLPTKRKPTLSTMLVVAVGQETSKEAQSLWLIGEFSVIGVLQLRKSSNKFVSSIYRLNPLYEFSCLLLLYRVYKNTPSSDCRSYVCSIGRWQSDHFRLQRLLLHGAVENKA